MKYPKTKSGDQKTTMKKSILIGISMTLLMLSFKDKQVKVNAANMGNYYLSDTSKRATWILKQNLSDDSKIEFYQAGEIEPTFMAVMKDSTHFKTQHEFSHTSNQVTKMWNAKGTFLGNGQMELVIHLSDVTSGLKFSFSFDEDEKVIYTKR
jgi:hypothetical protein